MSSQLFLDFLSGRPLNVGNTANNGEVQLCPYRLTLYEPRDWTAFSCHRARASSFSLDSVLLRRRSEKNALHNCIELIPWPSPLYGLRSED